MTQAEYDAEVNVIEQEQQRLRTLLSVADLVPRDWRLDGLEFRRKMNILDAESESLKQRKQYSAFMNAERLRLKIAEKKAKGNRDKELHRERWGKIVTADIAMSFKQQGFTVRCIGLKEWQVAV